MKNDGGPAFPRPASPGAMIASESQRGMTLRDYFAGQALAALLVSDSDSETSYRDTVKNAYYIADAMLEERNK